MNTKYWLKICEEIGSEAFSEIKRISEGDREKVMGVGSSGDKTLLIDDAIEKIAIEHLKKTGESFIFISEECGRKVVGKNPEVVIALDPLDGSNNFMQGIPFYSISIAVSSSENLNSVGVAYIKNLVTGDVYTAIKNGGAYKNGEKIVVRKKEGMVILTEFTKFGVSDAAKVGKKFFIRKLGSICLSMCFVAEGKVEACVIAGNDRTLDLSAAYLILKEAGAIITTHNNKEVENVKIDFNTHLDLVISGNEKIHSKILSVLSD